MLRCRSLAALAVAAAAAATPRPSAAALAVPASVEELARASSAVARGRVVAVSMAWSADHRRIETQAEVEVSSTWRGAVPARIEVLAPGGAVGGIAQRVVGAPHFAAGEEVVLFLWRAGAESRFRVTGLAQGKFTVAGTVARPDLSGTAFVPRQLRAGERRVESMAVDELERRVRSAQ